MARVTLRPVPGQVPLRRPRVPVGPALPKVRLPSLRAPGIRVARSKVPITKIPVAAKPFRQPKGALPPGYIGIPERGMPAPIPLRMHKLR